MTRNILLVGVGGQGTILASKLLTIGLMEKGYDVKMSEIHGMSQRGGSVSSQIRYGEKVYSPVIEEGDVDLLISFEKLEALRWLEYLKREGGRVVANDIEIYSMPILTGVAEYPHDCLDIVKSKVKEVTVINATKLAEELGNGRVMNIILLGTIVKSMELTDIDWEKIIRANVKPQFAELNVKALQKGMSLV